MFPNLDTKSGKGFFGVLRFDASHATDDGKWHTI
jgi:hypothetical protein